MTALAVLTVLESTLPSLCLSYKIQDQEAAVTVLTPQNPMFPKFQCNEAQRSKAFFVGGGVQCNTPKSHGLQLCQCNHPKVQENPVR